MRVLMQNRLSDSSGIGGDSVQLLNTKRALEELGVTVDTGSPPPRPLEDYDIIHLFNLITYDTFVHWSRATKTTVPIALSSIYWPEVEYNSKGSSPTGYPTLDRALRPLSQLEPIQKGVRIVRDIRLRTPRTSTRRDFLRTEEHLRRKRIIESCRCVLPNSMAEAEVLESEFGIDKDRMQIVPNGVSKAFFDKSTSPTAPSEFRGEDYAVSVARVDARKNSFRLIKACTSLNVPLLLIGSYDERDRYYRACVRAAKRGRVVFRGPLPPDSEVLRSAYRCAAVHALVSWFETPGLSSLEAAASGCRIVSTTRGSTREYFGDYAFYAEPGDLDSIRGAIKAALSDREDSKRISALEEKIRAQFTWALAGKKTLDGYKRVLEEARRP